MSSTLLDDNNCDDDDGVNDTDDGLSLSSLSLWLGIDAL